MLIRRSTATLHDVVLLTVEPALAEQRPAEPERMHESCFLTAPISFLHR